MEEVAKLLGPWPVLQLIFGVAVFSFGVYMIVRGSQKKDHPYVEDRREEWAAYEQLRNIEENSFKMVAHLERIHQELQRMTSILWNREKL